MIVAPEQGDTKIKTAQWMILLVERKELKQKKAQWIVPSAHAGGIFIGADMQLKILSEKFPPVRLRVVRSGNKKMTK